MRLYDTRHTELCPVEIIRRRIGDLSWMYVVSFVHGKDPEWSVPQAAFLRRHEAERYCIDRAWNFEVDDVTHRGA